MPAGRLDQSIELQRPTWTKGAAGEDVASWATVSTVRASVEPVTQRVRENFDAGADVAELVFKVTIRRYIGLAPHWRIVWASPLQGTLTLDIEGINAVKQRGQYIELVAKALH